MTVTAPPRPPRRPNDPLTHEEFDALVEAVIEEARQRGRRRRRRNGAIVTLVALVGVTIFALFGSGAQSQTAWIYLSNVIWALGLQDRGSRGYSAREQEEIARALGRVVAHELVHAVAPDIPHSRTGLMADTMGRSLLLQRTLSLAPAEQAALRAGVAGPWSPVAAVSTPLAFTAVRR